MDLRCPFGCREYHRRQRSCQRSAAYYQTAAGKAKRQRLNARRKCISAPLHRAPPQNPGPPPPPATAPVPAELPEQAELRLEGVVLDEPRLTNSPLLPHARMVVNVIEGLQLARRQFLDLLLEALRQRSIASRKRADYVLSYLHEHPP